MKEDNHACGGLMEELQTDGTTVSKKTVTQKVKFHLSGNLLLNKQRYTRGKFV